MIFAELGCEEAIDCYLAHSVIAGKQRIRKGQQLTSELIRQLQENGVSRVTVAKLEAGDIHEDEAATQLAAALAGSGLYLGEARTGRVNVFAAGTGLLAVERQLVLASNSVSSAITIATLPENSWVPQGKMVATAKIIPFGVAAKALQAAITAGTSGDGQLSALQLHAPQPQRAHLIQTTLPGTSTKLLEKTVQITRDRLHARAASLISSSDCAHESQSLATVLNALIKSPDCQTGDWILLAGASAISDSNDIIPSAVRQLGGVIDRFGIPVDPGNLLMTGQLNTHAVIGLPGCARSPKLNGFDRFLDRLSCGLALEESWINSLAVGGLLNEIPERPQPRSALPKLKNAENSQTSDKTGKMTAVVLAAGQSSRFGTDNKLLAVWNGKPVLRQTLDALTASDIDEILLVTGYEREQVIDTLPQLQADANGEAHTATYSNDAGRERPLTVIHNSHFTEGLASSLRSAISFLSIRDKPAEIEHSQAVMVCLGDMPAITTSTYDQLIAAWRAACAADKASADCAFIPSYRERIGNPVILTASLFDNLLSLRGDSGARKLLASSPGIVKQIAVNDAAVLLDIDTPAELDSLEPKL